MRRLPTADSIVEIGRKSRSWIKLRSLYSTLCACVPAGVRWWSSYDRKHDWS